MTSRAEELQKLVEGFHRIKRVTDAHRALSAPKNRPLTTTQWLALRAIAREEKVSIKGLKKALGVTSSAATQVVNELVKAGRVVRRADPDDARVTLIALSPETRKAFMRLRRDMLRRLETLFSALNDREFAQYMALHGKLMATIDKR